MDVYRAVDSVDADSLFHFHEKPNQLCPVGRNVHGVLDPCLARAQHAMERELQSVTMAQVRGDLQHRLDTEES